MNGGAVGPDDTPDSVKAKFIVDKGRVDRGQNCTLLYTALARARCSLGPE